VLPHAAAEDGERGVQARPNAGAIPAWECVKPRAREVERVDDAVGDRRAHGAGERLRQWRE
jgi:hypothetical protein